MDHLHFTQNEKAAMPDQVQAVRLCLLRFGLCISGGISFLFCSVFLPRIVSKIFDFTIRQIQSRKVHENLVDAQLARRILHEFFLRARARCAPREIQNAVLSIAARPVWRAKARCARRQRPFLRAPPRHFWTGPFQSAPANTGLTLKRRNFSGGPPTLRRERARRARRCACAARARPLGFFHTQCIAAK